MDLSSAVRVNFDLENQRKRRAELLDLETDEEISSDKRKGMASHYRNLVRMSKSLSN